MELSIWKNTNWDVFGQSFLAVKGIVHLLVSFNSNWNYFLDILHTDDLQLYNLLWQSLKQFSKEVELVGLWTVMKKLHFLRFKS